MKKITNKKSIELFYEILRVLDKYLIYKNRIHNTHFNQLYDDLGEEIAEFNLEVANLKGDSETAFHESTLKHQIFTYFPYHKFPLRKEAIPALKDTNDLAFVVAGYLLDRWESEGLNELNIVRFFEDEMPHVHEYMEKNFLIAEKFL